MLSKTIREGGDLPWVSGEGFPLERGEERGWRGVEVALLIVVVEGIWPFLNGLLLLSTEEKRERVVAAAAAAADVVGAGVAEATRRVDMMCACSECSCRSELRCCMGRMANQTGTQANNIGGKSSGSGSGSKQGPKGRSDQACLGSCSVERA